jgi:hypothetical protein
MRKSLVTAVFAASILSTTAFAASSDVGPIKAIDAAKHQLTLSDGKIFLLPATWNAAGFKVGDKVKVTYTMQGGKMMASDVSKAS